MSIKLKGSSDGSVSFDAPADTSPSGSDITLTLPTSAGSANQFLKNSGIAGELEYSSMVETSTGVGIGTSSPVKQLQVGAHGSSSEGTIALASTTSGTCSILMGDGATGSDFYRGYVQYSNTDDAMLFATSASERVRINNVGRVLFGRAISNDPWLATGNVDAGQYFGAGDNFGAAINSRNIPLILNRTNTTGTIQEFKYNGSITGYITTSASAITITYSSDYRLKENVIPLADAITRVKQLQPKRFNYIIDPDVTVDGFLAHEAQTVVPEAVVGTHNQVDDNGDPVYQGIDPSKMIPLLTAALQEAIAKIETLETKVAALEAV